MAMSNKERQRRYREARKGGLNDEFRLNTFVSVEAHRALRRLSKAQGITMRGLLETLAIQAEQNHLKSMQHDSQEWENYLELADSKPATADITPVLNLVPDRHVWKCPRCNHTIEAMDEEELRNLQAGHKYLDCSESWE